MHITFPEPLQGNIQIVSLQVWVEIGGEKEGSEEPKGDKRGEGVRALAVLILIFI